MGRVSSSLLTIIVPTLDPNLELLSETLSSLISFTEGRTSFSILVVDNGSRTPVSASLFSDGQKFDNVGFIRFEQNLGFSRNLVRAARATSDRYIWFVGDDDLIRWGKSSDQAFFSTLDIASPLPLSANFFNDGNTPTWRFDGADLSLWAGSAMSTVIFPRELFLRTADKILAVSDDQIWIHLLVLKVTSSRDLDASISQIDLPQVAVRVGRNQNWESHFGSQYKAGISVLKSLAELCEAGIYQVADLRAQLESRLVSNRRDVATLTASLGVGEMKSAKSDLIKVASITETKVSKTDAILMSTPRAVRSATAFLIILLGRLKSKISSKICQ